jgi:hypothetical protein
MTTTKEEKATAPVKAKTQAELIWEEIKDKQVDIFGLPEQFVDMHCQPVPIEPSKLYLTAKASAFLPSLETALGNKYLVERADKYIVVVKK